MPSCWLCVPEGTTPCGQRSIAISPIGMPDSRIIIGASGTQRAPTLYGPSRSATGTGEAVTLSLHPQLLQCRSPDDRPSPEPCGPGLTSRLTLHECTVTVGLPNKPLERAGITRQGECVRACAGRSAPSR